MTLTIHDVRGKLHVNSKELYSCLELNEKFYYRWTRSLIKNPCIDEGNDYQAYLNHSTPTKPGRPVKQYLLSLSLTNAICISTGTAVSKKIKDALEIKRPSGGRLKAMTLCF